MSTSAESLVSQVLEPVFRTLPPEAARRIVELQADEGLQQRVEELARKANEGALSEEERQQYAEIISAGDVLATMQALARRTLRESDGQ
jgi:hypothetical protein